MALTFFQRAVCRLLARNRILSGESYVAGGAALNEALDQTRVSRDLDLFHDSYDAVFQAWNLDRRTLVNAGYSVEILIERPSYVEAIIQLGGDRIEMQWAEDSAYRFFPLVEHPDFGLTLHPFDLATNKVLALVGRLEVRDWIDLIACCEMLQPLGYLAWASSGKDPGLNPKRILDEAARSSRYTRVEINALAFDGVSPDAEELSHRWRGLLDEARAVIELLPTDNAGTCVLDRSGCLLRAGSQDLGGWLSHGGVQFHHPTLRGAFPTLIK